MLILRHFFLANHTWLESSWCENLFDVTFLVISEGLRISETRETQSDILWYNLNCTGHLQNQREFTFNKICLLVCMTNLENVLINRSVYHEIYRSRHFWSDTAWTEDLSKIIWFFSDQQQLNWLKALLLCACKFISIYVCLFDLFAICSFVLIFINLSCSLSRCSLLWPLALQWPPQ